MNGVIASYVIDVVYLMVVCMVAKLGYSSFMELRVVLDASSTNQSSLIPESETEPGIKHISIGMRSTRCLHTYIHTYS